MVKVKFALLKKFILVCTQNFNFDNQHFKSKKADLFIVITLAIMLVITIDTMASFKIQEEISFTTVDLDIAYCFKALVYKMVN